MQQIDNIIYLHVHYDPRNDRFYSQQFINREEPQKKTLPPALAILDVRWENTSIHHLGPYMEQITKWAANTEYQRDVCVGFSGAIKVIKRGESPLINNYYDIILIHTPSYRPTPGR